MGFILIDFKKKDERSRLNKLVAAYQTKMNKWVRAYPNDGTPPGEDECAELEDAQITTFLEEFDAEAKVLWRVEKEVPSKRTLLKSKLEKKKGKLYRRFSDTVDALKDQAAEALTFCLDALKDSETELTDMLPVGVEVIEKEFEELAATCNSYVENSYPEGVAGLDAYDDDLPEGIPSYTDFQALCEEKQAAIKDASERAIPAHIESLKEKTLAMCKEKIDEAIQKATEDIVTDLSDDVLTYLSEEDMLALREELVGSAKEYGASRLA